MSKILITGANRGLGLMIARQAVERGHQVMAGVRKTLSAGDPLFDLSQENENVKIVQLEVVDDESVRQAADFIEKEWGSVDVIVNNAAILRARDQSLEQLDFEMLEESFQVNLYGVIRVMKFFLPLLYKGDPDQRTVLNISSEAGSLTNAYGGDYPYALTKAALNMFSEQLHQLLSKENIPVYSIHPGWMRTDMGGPNAHLDPNDSAKKILDILEGRPDVEGPFRFIDYTGRPMEI